MGGAKEGLERSPLPPILDNEGKLEKLERHCPTPEKAETKLDMRHQINRI